MHFVKSNQDGRVYIRKFEIEKIVYFYMKDNEQKLRCYFVEYDESQITMHIKEQSSINIKSLHRIQDELQKYLADMLGLYVDKIIIKLG